MNRGVEKILDYLRRRTTTEEELEAADLIEEQAAQIEMMRQAIQALENDSEECLDFDECTAVLVPIDTFHALIDPMVLSPDQALEQFAAKVREQCALICDEHADDPVYCGAAIRTIKGLPPAN